RKARRGDHRQRPALLERARRTEQAPRRTGVDSVERVQDYGGVAAALSHSLRALDRDLGDLRLLVHWTVETAARDVQRRLGPPLRDLLGPNAGKDHGELDV